MSDAVELEINVGGVRLAIGIRVLGGDVVSVRERETRPQTAHEGRGAPGGAAQQRSAPHAAQGAPSGAQHAGGRAAYGKSILPALNAAREAAGLADGRGAGLLADFLGLEKLTVRAVEEWLDEDTRRSLDDLMHGARELGARPRGGRR